MSSAGSRGVALLSSPVRRAIVDHLANWAEPDVGVGRPAGLTAAELAEVLGLHMTTARFHLDQLVAGGLVETSFVKQGVGRPRKVYRLAPGSLQAEDDHAMGVLTALLAESFGATVAGEPITPDDAGRRWAHRHVPPTAEPVAPASTPGAWLAKIGRLVDTLRPWGYTPRLSTSSGGRTVELDLVHCPFLDLARSHPAVVCGVHRGLIAGTLEQLGEPEVEVSLEPFVGPSRCTAHVTTAARFSPPLAGGSAAGPASQESA